MRNCSSKVRRPHSAPFRGFLHDDLPLHHNPRDHTLRDHTLRDTLLPLVPLSTRGVPWDLWYGTSHTLPGMPHTLPGVSRGTCAVVPATLYPGCPTLYPGCPVGPVEWCQPLFTRGVPHSTRGVPWDLWMGRNACLHGHPHMPVHGSMRLRDWSKTQATPEARWL